MSNSSTLLSTSQPSRRYRSSVGYGIEADRIGLRWNMLGSMDGWQASSASNISEAYYRPYIKIIGALTCWETCWSYSMVTVKVDGDPTTPLFREINGGVAKVVDASVGVDIIISFP